MVFTALLRSRQRYFVARLNTRKRCGEVAPQPGVSERKRRGTVMKRSPYGKTFPAPSIEIAENLWT
jgi:hypothetical protein